MKEENYFSLVANRAKLCAAIDAINLIYGFETEICDKESVAKIIVAKGQILAAIERIDERIDNVKKGRETHKEISKK